MLSLLIDENLNHRILRGLVRSVPALDFKFVNDVTGELGTEDEVVLKFAAELGLVVVTHDLRTFPKHAYERVRAGLEMAGVIAVPNNLAIGRAIEDLAVLAECAKPSELISMVLYLPL